MAATTGFGTGSHRTGTGIKIGGALAALAVLLGGYWAIGQMTAPTALEGYGARWAPVHGGMLKLGPIQTIKPSRAVSDRFRRFGVTATVAAGDKGMIVSSSSFRISGFHVYEGMEPVKSRPSVIRIKPNKRAIIRLVYQVTADAGDFSLIFEGGRPIPFQVNGSNR